MATETNIHRMFNTDANAMQNHNNMTALLLQILVQHYIEQKHKKSGYYVYSEAINDIDIFNKELHTIGIIRDGLKANIKIKTFLDILPDNSYVSSYEVKTGKLSYILQFKNLLQLITKTRYQPKTKLGLILIPYRVNVDIEELQEKYTLFDKLKNDILSKPISTQRKIFNTLINKTFLFNVSILDAIIHVLGMEENGKLKTTYETLKAVSKRRDRIARHLAVIINCLQDLKYCDVDIMELKAAMKSLNKLLSKTTDETISNVIDSIHENINNIDNLLTDIRANIFSIYNDKGKDDIVNLINDSSKKITREAHNNKDLTNEQFHILRNNFMNSNIIILSLDELTKYNISTKYLMRVIRSLDK